MTDEMCQYKALAIDVDSENLQAIKDGYIILKDINHGIERRYAMTHEAAQYVTDLFTRNRGAFPSKVEPLNEMRPTIHEVCMDCAEAWSRRGTCLRKKVGAVIADTTGAILSSGYNGSLPGRPHCDEPGVGCLMEDGHCVRTVHAEANAILNAAKRGISLAGATLYTTASPCWPCYRMIVQAGITTIYMGEAYGEVSHLDEMNGNGVRSIFMALRGG